MRHVVFVRGGGVWKGGGLGTAGWEGGGEGGLMEVSGDGKGLLLKARRMGWGGMKVDKKTRENNRII